MNDEQAIRNLVQTWLNSFSHQHGLDLQRRQPDDGGLAVSSHLHVAVAWLQVKSLRRVLAETHLNAVDRHDFLAQWNVCRRQAVVGRRVHAVKQMYDDMPSLLPRLSKVRRLDAHWGGDGDRQ